MYCDGVFVFCIDYSCHHPYPFIKVAKRKLFVDGGRLLQGTYIGSRRFLEYVFHWFLFHSEPVTLHVHSYPM